jgi:hypothetical protein
MFILGEIMHYFSSEREKMFKKSDKHDSCYSFYLKKQILIMSSWKEREGHLKDSVSFFRNKLEKRRL